MRIFLLLDGWKRGDSTGVLIARALSLLGTLIVTDDPSQSPYGSLAVDKDSLEDYPINLVSLRRRTAKWRDMTLPDAPADLVAWCQNTHFLGHSQRRLLGYWAERPSRFEC